MKRYFYGLLRKYVSLFVRPQNSVVEIDPTTRLLVGALPHGQVAFRSGADDNLNRFDPSQIVSLEHVRENAPEYLVLGGSIHYERDIQALLTEVRGLCSADTRLILTYYSSLWRPLAALASMLGLRRKFSQPNWLAHEDIINLLRLSDFELVRLDQDARRHHRAPAPVRRGGIWRD